jgi:hypothetical protein
MPKLNGERCARHLNFKVILQLHHGEDRNHTHTLLQSWVALTIRTLMPIVTRLFVFITLSYQFRCNNVGQLEHSTIDKLEKEFIFAPRFVDTLHCLSRGMTRNLTILVAEPL